MRTATPRLTLVAATVALATAACGKKDLYFATSSNIGLDVAGDTVSPVQASFGFQRREVAQVPASKDGEAFSVYGNLDVDMRWFGERLVRQTFATGEAAESAAEVASAEEAGTMVEPEPLCTGRACIPLVFASHSVVGVHAVAGTAPQPASFSLGYKRVEATWIPTDSGAQRTRAVFGDISLSTCGFGDCQAPAGATGSAPNAKATVTGGVRLSQTIATGAAAVIVASREDTKETLQAATAVARADDGAVDPGTVAAAQE